MWIRNQTKKYKKTLYLCLLLTFSMSSVANALQSSSTSYGVDETYFGNGGVLCDVSGSSGMSAHYCAGQTLGDLADGNSSSLDYQVRAGNLVTDRAPYLQLVVNNPSIDIGTLTTASTHVASAGFSVKSYLAGGYVVQTSSPGPQNGSYTMKGLITAAGSSIGNEQFGINLMANTCPTSAPSTGAGSCSITLGAGTTQVPDSTFSYGAPATGYNTANQYKYVNGDTIAKSTSSTGETDFTISYIFNVSNVTPGGVYNLQDSLVATSTF